MSSVIAGNRTYRTANFDAERVAKAIEDLPVAPIDGVLTYAAKGLPPRQTRNNYDHYKQNCLKKGFHPDSSISLVPSWFGDRLIIKDLITVSYSTELAEILSPVPKKPLEVIVEGFNQVTLQPKVYLKDLAQLAECGYELVTSALIFEQHKTPKGKWPFRTYEIEASSFSFPSEEDNGQAVLEIKPQLSFEKAMVLMRWFERHFKEGVE